MKSKQIGLIGFLLVVISGLMFFQTYTRTSTQLERCVTVGVSVFNDMPDADKILIFLAIKMDGYNTPEEYIKPHCEKWIAEGQKF